MRRSAARAAVSPPGPERTVLPAAWHRGQWRAFRLLVEAAERPVVLQLADELAQVAGERGIALLHRPGAVLDRERPLERRQLELVVRIRLVELRDQVVLDDDRVRATRRDLEERRVLVGERIGLRVRELALHPLLRSLPLERGDRLVRAVPRRDGRGRVVVGSNGEDLRVRDVRPAEADRLLPLRGRGEPDGDHVELLRDETRDEAVEVEVLDTQLDLHLLRERLQHHHVVARRFAVLVEIHLWRVLEVHAHDERSRAVQPERVCRVVARGGPTDRNGHGREHPGKCRETGPPSSSAYHVASSSFGLHTDCTSTYVLPEADSSLSITASRRFRRRRETARATRPDGGVARSFSIVRNRRSIPNAATT